MRVRLTDRFISSAKPLNGARTDYFDEVATGLALRVSEFGKKTWTFNFTYDGKRVRLTLGVYPSTSLAAARAKALEAKGHVDDGDDPRDLQAGAMTVAMLAENYLGMHVRPNLRTAAEFERRLERNVIPVIGQVKLSELHRRDALRVIDPIVNRGSPFEANHVLDSLRGMLQWAVSRGDIDHDPFEGVRNPGLVKPRERVLSADEIRTLWNRLPEVLPRRYERVIKLCLVTAQRLGEVSGMTDSEIDFDKRLWSIPGVRTKNAHPHSVPLTDLAIGLIKAEPLVAQVARNVTRAVGHRGADFGIPHWTIHDLRRTAITHMAQLGVTPIVLGHIANHRTITKASITLTTYAHYDYAKEKRGAMELWADRLEAIVSGKPMAEVVPFRSA